MVIDAELPGIGREYVIVQPELYLCGPGGEPDADKVAVDKPDRVVFNGYARQ